MAAWRRATTSASCRRSTAPRPWCAASPTIFAAPMLAEFPHVDGVVALTHGSGCGMDTHGDGMQVLRRTLGGYARHANFAGVLIVGLGCEANQISSLFGAENLKEGPLLRTFSIQDTGGTAKTIAHGVGIVREMLPHANEVDAAAGGRIEHHRRPPVRRFRRLLGHHRQSGAGRGGRPAGAPRRHGDPVRDARDLRRGASADAPRGVARGRREAHRADQDGGRTTRRARRAR